MLVGLLAASLSTAAPMPAEDSLAFEALQILQPELTTASPKEMQQPPLSMTSHESSLQVCMDQELPATAHFKTCEEQKAHGLCVAEHNRFPGGFCPKTCGYCEARMGRSAMWRAD